MPPEHTDPHRHSEGKEVGGFATLLKCDHLARMEDALEMRERKATGTSRHQRWTYPSLIRRDCDIHDSLVIGVSGDIHVLRTPLQNMVMAMRLADTLQPPRDSAATVDIRHTTVLIKVALE